MGSATEKLMPKKRRRRIDPYLRGTREDPEVVIQEMANLSNRLFRLLVGAALTAGLLILIWPFPGASRWTISVGVGLLLVLANCLGWLLVTRAQKNDLERPASFNQLILLVVVTVLASKVIFTIFAWEPYLAPVPMLAMVLALMFGQPVAFILVLGISFYLGLMSPRAEESLLRIDLVLSLSLAMGGVTSVLGMRRVRQQSRPVFVGIYAGSIQAAVVLAFQLIGGDPTTGRPYPFADLGSADLARFIQEPAWALLGGLVSGAAATCFLPALEKFFGIVTERLLLALTDPNTELLQALRNCAPGTYTHTLRVADLASAAAETIGADPLLARVGAYYHDVGKIKKPEYFVENKDASQNIHDRLRPSMSKLVIISHVKDGMEFAEEAGLPQKIIDMIPMHHGTTVVEYFFHKAKAEGDTRDEVEYRYPGPKPFFKEAGILMLADGVEAAAKTIAEPNPARFRTIVHELVLKKLLDHQLDESDLTMRDLKRIEDAFVHTLTYMYHGRIKYPGTEAAPVGGGPVGSGAQGPPSSRSQGSHGSGVLQADGRGGRGGSPGNGGGVKATDAQNHHDRQPAAAPATGPSTVEEGPGEHPRIP